MSFWGPCLARVHLVVSIVASGMEHRWPSRYARDLEHGGLTVCDLLGSPVCLSWALRSLHHLGRGEDAACVQAPAFGKEVHVQPAAWLCSLRRVVFRSILLMYDE